MQYKITSVLKSKYKIYLQTRTISEGRYNKCLRNCSDKDFDHM